MNFAIPEPCLIHPTMKVRTATCARAHDSSKYLSAISAIYRGPKSKRAGSGEIKPRQSRWKPQAYLGWNGLIKKLLVHGIGERQQNPRVAAAGFPFWNCYIDRRKVSPLNLCEIGESNDLIYPII
jgi:hypothetical protein